MSYTNLQEQYIPNILIVDDIPANLKVLGAILKEEGYKIRPVLSGEMALQVADKEKPDLILLDIMMPGMDGYEVCRKLKENLKLKEIPVIFISALNDTNDIIKAFSAGGVDYVTKPFQAKEVTARVATHLRICQQSKELKELNATKDKFFSIIAHDLRGPIGSMLQISEFISMEKKIDEDFLHTLLKSQKELSETTFHLLENLLNWARSNTNQIRHNPETLNINNIIDASSESLNVQINNKKILLSVDYSEQTYAFVDENMFRLIIRNLLSNAIKFTPKGGSINISTRIKEDNFIEVSVKDTGIGMDRDTLENLFRIDVKTNRSGTDGESSNGLGLMLCKEFVIKLGGKMEVVSEEGKGSIFSFTIPIHDAGSQ